MKNTFILYVFDIIRLYIFYNIFSQTLSNLTLTKPRMHGKNRQREYKLCSGWMRGANRMKIAV
jgi:hypothetical protein